MPEVTRIPYIAPTEGHMGVGEVTDANGTTYPMFLSEDVRCHIPTDAAVTFHLKEYRGKKYAVNVTAKL